MDINSLDAYNKHGHNQIKICVSGSADTTNAGQGTLDFGKRTRT